MMIEVDFDVYKALTSRRVSEAVTYNDVIRDLLRLPLVPEREPSPKREQGCVFDGVLFPDGTRFRKTYKGQTYRAEIRDGRWIGSDGAPRKSPSDAAVAITNNSVNGWRFWEFQRPEETTWRLMDTIPRARLA